MITLPDPLPALTHFLSKVSGVGLSRAIQAKGEAGQGRLGKPGGGFLVDRERTGPGKQVC